MTAEGMICVEEEKGLELGVLWVMVESCEAGMMRDVRLDIDILGVNGRDEDFIAFGRTEARRVLRRDMVSFMQKARSKEVKKAHSEMCIL